jgi:ribosomal protein S2
MASFMKSDNFQSLTKKEQLVYQRKFDKVNRVYSGAKDLKKRPDLVLVVDGAEM